MPILPRDSIIMAGQEIAADIAGRLPVSEADRLAARFWPGPLTLVLPRGPGSPISLLATAGLDTVVPHGDALRSSGPSLLFAPPAPMPQIA